MKSKLFGKSKPKASKVKKKTSLKKTSSKTSKKVVTIHIVKVFKVCFVASSLAVLAFLLYYFYLTIRHKVENVTVKQVNIVNASEYVAKYLEKELDFIIGKKVSEVNIDEIKRYVLSIDWVLAASVRKDYTGSLSVKVFEPNPYFLWINQDSIFYINSSKQTVRRFNKNLDDSLIKIYEGERALEELDLIRFVIYKDLDILREIDKLVYRGYRWDIYLKNGIQILLPEHNLDIAWDNILWFNHKYGILSRNIKTIDARITDRVSIIPNDPEI